ncbi:hypothetical protein HYALB_00003385 [Hymenoscyphus albidus]|uniref:Ribonuclease P protein subunit n=1 Tax=Hymenoscyphus albidus TaxID=595503 RepID=A0A9N9LL39_9HELO|nr:hypothetical protein HYALB_00003385 [Hymenoscyphus albidus]
MASKPPTITSVSNPKESIAQTLLSRAHPPEIASQIFTDKVKLRPLYLKPSEPSPHNAQQARRLKRIHAQESRKKKQKPKPLSSREKRALCLYDIPKSNQKYSIYEPLYRMWIGYIQEVLDISRSLPISSGTAAKLCSADYHGALLTVTRSRCVSRVGVEGIVVKDMKHAFEIVTKNDEVKLLPKEGTIFKFVIPIPEPKKEGVSEEDSEKTPEDGTPEEEGKKQEDLVFELHGDQFIYRASDRANRKFRPRFLRNL